MDPKIGKFQVILKGYKISAKAGENWKDTVIPVEGLNETKQDDVLQIYDKLGPSEDLEGLFTPIDSSMLEVRGTQSDVSQTYLKIQFLPCLQANDITCADKAEIDTFLDSHIFFFLTTSNHIDLLEVKPEQETLG